MRTLLKVLLMGAVGLFLLVFMALPMVSLVLVGFTGEPINLLGYLVKLDFTGLFREIGQYGSFDYYREFVEARRGEISLEDTAAGQ